MKRAVKKATSLALGISILSLQVPGAAAQSDKEEVIYSVMDSAGNVTGVYAVNIFPGGDITDYGDYSSVQMMNTKDAITDVDGVIHFTSSADRVYYQGDMPDAVMPWIFTIKYYLDGVETTAEEIGGKSGKIDIVIDIRHNPQDTSTFFESHAIQMTAKLDTETCRNIRADGATEANVGSVRQLTYILLPNTEKTYTISCDATDFEMDALAINGIKMDLDIDYDKSKITDKISDVKDAADEFDEGADDLISGTWEAYSGGIELRDGAQTLHNGLITLTDNNADLRSGVDKLVDAVLDTANDTIEDSKDSFKKLKIEIHTLTAQNYSAEITRLQNGLLNNVSDYVYEQAEKKLRERVVAAVYEQVYALVEEQVRANVTAAVNLKKDDITQAVTAQVRQYVIANWDDIMKMISGSNSENSEPSSEDIAEEEPEQAEEAASEVYAEVHNKAETEAREQVIAQVTAQVRRNLQANVIEPSVRASAVQRITGELRQEMMERFAADSLEEEPEEEITEAPEESLNLAEDTFIAANAEADEDAEENQPAESDETPEPDENPGDEVIAETENTNPGEEVVPEETESPDQSLEEQLDAEDHLEEAAEAQLPTDPEMSADLDTQETAEPAEEQASSETEESTVPAEPEEDQQAEEPETEETGAVSETEVYPEDSQSYLDVVQVMIELPGNPELPDSLTAAADVETEETETEPELTESVTESAETENPEQPEAEQMEAPSETSVQETILPAEPILPEEIPANGETEEVPANTETEEVPVNAETEEAPAEIPEISFLIRNLFISSAAAEELTPEEQADAYLASDEGQAEIASRVEAWMASDAGQDAVQSGTNAAMQTADVQSAIQSTVHEQMQSDYVNHQIEAGYQEAIGTDAVKKMIAERTGAAKENKNVLANQAVSSSQPPEQAVDMVMRSPLIQGMIAQKTAETIVSQIETTMVSDTILQTIKDNVDEQMKSETVQDTIDENVEHNRGGVEYRKGVADALKKYGRDGDAYEDLGDLKDQLDDLMKFYDGLGDYLDGTETAADGSQELLEGAETLAGNYSGNSSSGLGALYNGAVTLKDGTMEFKDKTVDIDDQIVDEADKMIDEKTGKNVEVTSFTSPKNGEVKSVQFVISTPSIKKPDVEPIEEETQENPGFVQKLLDLFK